MTVTFAGKGLSSGLAGEGSVVGGAGSSTFSLSSGTVADAVAVAGVTGAGSAGCGSTGVDTGSTGASTGAGAGAVDSSLALDVVGCAELQPTMNVTNPRPQIVAKEHFIESS